MAIVTVKYLGNFLLITEKKQEEMVINNEECVSSLIVKLRKKYSNKIFDITILPIF